MHLFSILAKTIMCESQKIQGTEGNSTAGGKMTDNNEWEKESASLQLVGQVSLGDLIWVKLHGNSWWPAVVVDEKSVSESSKPGGKSRGKVLVRLYGSHEYFYADPMKYHSEFKTILEQNNGNCYDILGKTLEQLRQKSIKPKGQGSKATGLPNKMKLPRNPRERALVPINMQRIKPMSNRVSRRNKGKTAKLQRKRSQIVEVPRKSPRVQLLRNRRGVKLQSKVRSRKSRSRIGQEHPKRKMRRLVAKALKELHQENLPSQVPEEQE
ncbi:uncharacterized protein LOC120191523 isoform X3 [Hibiscus syriacus]|uniref:uncharacterized protein LOC120191523 isoform X3 n=1 Tax=Hibiscus syriacus TaxID=106335 RepID=UPI0019233F52|nr:uncharacterized protein LOC120191523 isoform X3 [Hibiscus syriacus]